METLNYREDVIKVNGLRVTSLTMVGLLAEKLPSMARDAHINMHMLREADVSNYLLVVLDNLRGARKVGLEEADKTLALKVAVEVRENLRNVDLSIVDSCVEVRTQGGRKLGEHDLIVQVEYGKGALKRFLSVELKLRRLWTRDETEKRRVQLREECVGQRPASTRNCSWWQQEQGKYSGRLLVLVLFPDRAESSKVFKVNCDMLLDGEARFRPLFGWLGSLRVTP